MEIRRIIGPGLACACGCGAETAIIQRTDTANGRFRGETSRFLPGHAARLVPKLDPEERKLRQREYGRSPRRREWARLRQRGWSPETRERVNAQRRARLAADKDLAYQRVPRRDPIPNDAPHALAVLELDDGICGICGDDVDPQNFQVDHVIPRTLGGRHDYTNLQVSHPACNASKGAVWPQ